MEHASREPAFCEHPTPKLYGFESYIALPNYRTTGEYFGNMCAPDSAPAVLRYPRTLAMMELFAELISLQLTVEEESARAHGGRIRAESTAEAGTTFTVELPRSPGSPDGARSPETT